MRALQSSCVPRALRSLMRGWVCPKATQVGDRLPAQRRVLHARAPPLAGQRAGFCTSGTRTMTFDDLLGYAIWWSDQGGSDHTQLESLLREKLALLELASDATISLEDATIVLEEASVYLDEAQLEAYMQQDRGGSEPEADAAGAERAAFFDWAATQLLSSQDIIEFADRRGARVQIQNSAAKIQGHNGVQIGRIQQSTKAWNSTGDWKEFVGRLYDMGLRREIEDCDPPEWCKWCGKFRHPEDIQSCASTQFTCRRFEGKSWMKKL